jgi:hypothetical protein
LAEIPKVRPCESLPQVDDDPVGYPEPMGVSSMNFVASFDVTVVTLRTSIHFVNLSTATWICL